MNDVPADSPYSPEELDRWLGETSAPLSDYEMEERNKYIT